MRKDCCKGHMVLPLPGTAAPVMSLQGYTDSMAHNDNCFIGLTPILIAPYVWMIHRIWAVFETAEAAATAENHTQVTFKMGDNIAGATTLGTVNTSGSPAAGEPLVAYLNAIPEYGKILIAVPAVVGAGGTNLSGAGFGFGVDLIPVRAG